MVRPVSSRNDFRPPSQVNDKAAEGNNLASYGVCILGGAFLISAALFAIGGLGYGGVLSISALGNGLLMGSGALVFTVFSIFCCSVLSEIRKDMTSSN